jgi:hypothetical protein
MNKKTMMVLAALGIAQAKETLANDLMGLPVVNSTNPAIVAQSLQVNVDTVRVLRMFADMGALQFNNESGSVEVNPTNLPNVMVRGLSESTEVALDEGRDVYVLTDSFVSVLAQNHVFTQLGTQESVQANRTILNRLRENTTPVPRQDQVYHAESSFIAGH